MRQAPDVGSFYLSSGSEWGVSWAVTSGLCAVGHFLRFPECWVVGGTGFNTAFILPVGSLSVVPVASALRGIYFFYSNL